MFPLVLLSVLALPPAPGRIVQPLTQQTGFYTEPSISVNPRDPNQVVAAFQDNAHIAFSHDGGKHWQLASGIEPPNYRVSGDVSVAFDSQGQATLCYMAFDKTGTFNYWGHNSSRNGLFIRRSTDGGATWDATHIPVIEHPTEPAVPWEDKPYVVADPFHSSNLYVGWTRWTLKHSQILLSRSRDKGATWSAPIELDSHPGLPRDDNGALEGFEGTIGPDGTLYAVWADGAHIVLTTSKDGQKFSKPRDIVPTAPIMFAIQGVARANGFPQISLDPRASKHGKLYLTWSDYRNGDLDVFSSSSSDEGKTWSDAVRVNNDEMNDGADQYFQWMAVDPVDSSINVLFYDRRNDPQNRKQTVVLARSTDGGKTFANYEWSERTFDPNDQFIGDYSGIAAYGGRVYGVWTERIAESKEVSGKRRRPDDMVIEAGVADFTK